MPCSLDQFPALARFVSGQDASWASLGISAPDLLALADVEELRGVLFDRMSLSRHAGEWPVDVRETLSSHARDVAAAELLLAREIRHVVDALAAEGVRAVLLKGTPLAFTVYQHSGSRPRQDTDLLVRSEDIEPARRVMAACGYATTVHCNDLFSQFEVQKVDGYGVRHVFDVHWKVSAQPVFADVLAHDELLVDARAIPALGPNAIGAGTIDALLLACVHPVMHHRNEERALWIYDIHLLASLLYLEDFDRFAELAVRKKVAAVCRHSLTLAQKTFDTPLPDAVFARLAAASHEPSAAYLGDDRRWRDELVSSVRDLPTLRDRVTLLRKVLFPSPSYILGAYGFRSNPLANLLLPALYLHRNVAGAMKVLAGKK